MSNNNDYTTGNLLDSAYFKENYKLIAIDLSKQSKLKDSEQISFNCKLLATQGATMFFMTVCSCHVTYAFRVNPHSIVA